MKFKIGDRIKYGSDEWLFYGTVSAIIENSISPLYRINVERMEKNNCKFSITQFEFEFELVADTDINTKKDTEIEDLNNYEELNDDNSTVAIISEPEVKEINGKIHSQEQRKYQTKISKLWMDKLKLYQKGEKNNRSMYKWAFLNRLQYKEGNLSEDKYKKLKAINFPFEVDSKNIIRERKISDIWNKNFELYQKGEKNNIQLYAWVYQNRLEYKKGDLLEAKYEKLKAINFPFDLDKNSHRLGEISENWNAKYELFLKGESNDSLSHWKNKNRKLYKAGKLSEAKYKKLQEINFPFEVFPEQSWNKNFELYQKGERNKSLRNWEYSNRKRYEAGNLSEDKYNKLKAINFPFESDKNTKNFRVITKKWNEKYESYRNGDMNSLIYSWMFNNRALYKAGKLSEVKYKKLQEINFPFESIVDKKKYAIISKPEIDDSWNAKYELYRKGDKSEDLNIWKSENRKQFIDGKLPEAKYEK